MDVLFILVYWNFKYSRFRSNVSKNFNFGGPTPLSLHRWGWNLAGPLLHAKFHPHWCNVSPLQGEKPQNWPLSKLNTGRFVLRAMLPVIIIIIITTKTWNSSHHDICFQPHFQPSGLIHWRHENNNNNNPICNATGASVTDPEAHSPAKPGNSHRHLYWYSRIA